MKFRYLILMFIGFLICIFDFQIPNSTLRFLIVIIGMSIFSLGWVLFIDGIKKANKSTRD